MCVRDKREGMLCRGYGGLQSRLRAYEDWKIEIRFRERMCAAFEGGSSGWGVEELGD